MARRDYEWERDRYRDADRWRREQLERERDRDRNRFGENRGFLDRASDEVRSWFGDDRAERRRDWDERLDEREERMERINGGTLHSRPGELMTRDVATVHPDDGIERAAKLMRECDCGALPVVNDTGRLVGMITDRDITVRLVARGRDTRSCRISDAMTRKTFACHEWDEIEGCMESMAHHQVRRLPIVDERDRVIGIVSQGDLAQFIGRSRRPGERRAIADVLTAISEPSSKAYR
jgi:CBS-domain-containing membrane protein